MQDADPPAAKPQEQGKSPGSVAKPSTPKRWTPPKKSQPAEVSYSHGDNLPAPLLLLGPHISSIRILAQVKAEFVPKPVQSEAPTHINPPQDLKYTPGKDVLAYEELKGQLLSQGLRAQLRGT